MTNNNLQRQVRLVTLLAIVMTISACNSFSSRHVVKDFDQDGVADAIDACQRTGPNSPVDELGCSLFEGSIESVVFKPNDHNLNANSRESLESLVVLLNTHPEIVLQLGGHTDNRGAARGNLMLSKRRVMSVVQYLVANGIDGNRLKPFGFGESRPVMSNATAQGRSENRRIEMSVFTQ